MRGRHLLVVAALSFACGREKPPQASGDAPEAFGFPAPRATGSAGRWDRSLGPVIATPAIENATPLLFVPDTTSTTDFDVELFTHDAQVTRATMSQVTPRRGCAWERTAVLSAPAEQGVRHTWSLALAPGAATAIAVEGVGELLPRDSAALVARFHRLVNALPDDSLSAPFRGLAIVVRDAWQIHAGDGTTVALAVATRTLNVESNPRSEVTTMIIEPDSAAGPDAWRTVFARRDSGPEDRVEGADLLAALRLRDGRTAVALVRENEQGLQLDIVERTAPARWRLRWSSASLPCPR